MEKRNRPSSDLSPDFERSRFKLNRACLGKKNVRQRERSALNLAQIDHHPVAEEHIHVELIGPE